MLKKTVLLLLVVGLALAFSLPGATRAQDAKPIFYWISHGSPSDPIWVLSQQGAQLAAKDFGVEVRTSFHSNDVAKHKEAFQSAIAAKASGIASTSPDPKSLIEEVKAAHAAGIPVILFNSDDPDTGRDAYIGASVYEVGIAWAKYLVDKGLVKQGDFVWMPVEVPGATYQVDETRGIASVFDPLGIKYEVFDAKYEQSQALSNMVDYLTANKDKIKAIIGLGDLVTGSIQRAFAQVGIKPGTIPVVGWGNSLETALAVKAGYVNAGMWQYPNSQSYLSISMLYLATHGVPPSFNIITMALYDQSTVDIYIKQLEEASKAR
jgi:simple sugar transport system substrate-binding protein